jgi:hypothetical protein
VTCAQAARAAVVGFAAGLAYLAGQLHPIFALAPLVVLGVPAAALLWAGRGGRDPYDVGARYGVPPRGEKDTPDTPDGVSH